MTHTDQPTETVGMPTGCPQTHDETDESGLRHWRFKFEAV